MAKLGILIGLLCGFSCSGSLSLITSNSYWREHSLRSAPANALTNGEAMQIVQCEGLYHPMVTAINMPALFYVTDGKQLAYVPLSAELDCGNGDWVMVTGRAEGHQIPLPFGQHYETRAFKVESCRIMRSTHHLSSKAQDGYHLRRRKIQQIVQKEGSKLLLPDKPDWLMVLDSVNQRIVATFSAADLLYAAQVDFVYDFDENLLAVYVNQWFKGE